MRILFLICIHLETPIWVFMQMAPITNERDTTVLYLFTFTDITALKQPVETEDTKSSIIYILTTKKNCMIDF